MQQKPYNPALHVVAILTAAATFPLIFMGGLVTTLHAGMSVPDWPNTYGYNMFLFPPNQWVGGILYEHTHRLMGTVVGFLAVVLVLVAWGPSARPAVRARFAIATVAGGGFAALSGLILFVILAAGVPNIEVITARTGHAFVGALSVALVCFVACFTRRPEPRRWVRWLTVAVLLAVIVQGILGGLRVRLVALDLAIVHGCFAQAFFCLAAFAVLATSRLWSRLPDLRGAADVGGLRLARWAAGATLLVYAQLVVGATMRHYDAGLAIPDVPLHYGKLLPPTNAAALDAANLWRAQSGVSELRPVTLTQIWLHAGHRLGAVLVTTVLTILIVKSLRRRESWVATRTPALLLIPLLLTQLTLGVLTVLLYKPADVASLHVGVGALVLMTTFVLAARAVRVYGWRARASLPAAGFTAGRPGVDRQNDRSAVVLTS
jgi:cytochrome c oxidase assembly protein subunit 15